MITFARFCYLNGYLNFKYGKCGVLFPATFQKPGIPFPFPL